MICVCVCVYSFGSRFICHYVSNDNFIRSKTNNRCSFCQFTFRHSIVKEGALSNLPHHHTLFDIQQFDSKLFLSKGSSQRRQEFDILLLHTFASKEHRIVCTIDCRMRKQICIEKKEEVRGTQSLNHTCPDLPVILCECCSAGIESFDSFGTQTDTYNNSATNKNKA